MSAAKSNPKLPHRKVIANVLSGEHQRDLDIAIAHLAAALKNYLPTKAKAGRVLYYGRPNHSAPENLQDHLHALISLAKADDDLTTLLRQAFARSGVKLDEITSHIYANHGGIEQALAMAWTRV